MSTIKVDTIATRTGSGNITASNTIAGTSATLSGTLGVTGNVLVGTTNVNPAEQNVAGIGLLASNTISVTDDGGAPIQLNRKSSDGSIAIFRRDGSSKGNIGTNGGDLYIAGTTHGLKFDSIDSTTTYLRPTNVSGTNITGQIDLGQAGNVFRDAYFSGGVYFAPNAYPANYLDDYEEGTWTPALSTGNSSSYDGRSGHYTKIGRQVIATFKLEIGSTFAGGTTQYLVSGLPFTAVSGLTHSTGSGFLHYYENLRQNVTGVTMRVDAGQSVMYFSAYASANNGLSVNANILQAQSNIYGTVVYITA